MVHPEAVLFVDDDEAQAFEHHRGLKEGMSADEHVDGACREVSKSLFPLGLFRGTHQKSKMQGSAPGPLKPREEFVRRSEVLGSQDFRRCHHGDLTTAGHHGQC